MTSALVTRQQPSIGEVGVFPQCVRVELFLAWAARAMCHLNTRVLLSALAYDQHML